MAGLRIELPPFSMFSSTPVYQIGSDVVFGMLNDPIVADGSDELWPVPASAVPRLDLISNTFYGTPNLWWVIALVNDVLDPLVGVPQGTQIRVPTRQRLASLGILNA